MNKPPSSPGPVFAAVARQDHPSPKVHDLGITMQWQNHSARLYRNVRVHAPFAFSFDDVLIHEEDAPGAFAFQMNQVWQTKLGNFYSLSPYMVALYARDSMDRYIFDALAELDALLPPERQVTADDVAHLCQTLGKAAPLPPPPPVDPPTGMLAPELELQGYRISKWITVEQEGYAMLDIGWTSKNRTFFTGVFEVRPTEDGISGHWRLPGPQGVNQLLRQEFEKLCPDPAQCLTPEGIQHCISNVPYGAGKSAKHLSNWSTKRQPPFHAPSSSKTSRPTTELS